MKKEDSVADKKDTTIKFYASLDEMANDNYEWLATLTPEQHLQNALTHIKQIFAQELKDNPKLGKNLYFDN